MRENLFRLWFVILMATLLALVAKNVFAEEVPIRCFLYPKAVVAGMKGATVRFESIVARHEANRLWTLNVWTDGQGTWQYRQVSLDGEGGGFPTCISGNDRPCHFEVFPGHWVFAACVHRTQPGTDKLKAYCARQEIEVK